MGAPQRRTIYTASLEAHIDRLHQQLEACGYPPATKEQLQPYHGLNAKTAKVSHTCVPYGFAADGYT